MRLGRLAASVLLAGCVAACTTVVEPSPSAPQSLDASPTVGSSEAATPAPLPTEHAVEWDWAAISTGPSVDALTAPAIHNGTFLSIRSCQSTDP